MNGKEMGGTTSFLKECAQHIQTEENITTLQRELNKFCQDFVESRAAVILKRIKEEILKKVQEGKYNSQREIRGSFKLDYTGSTGLPSDWGKKATPLCLSGKLKMIHGGDFGYERYNSGPVLEELLFKREVRATMCGSKGLFGKKRGCIQFPQQLNVIWEILQQYARREGIEIGHPRLMMRDRWSGNKELVSLSDLRQDVIVEGELYKKIGYIFKMESVLFELGANIEADYFVKF